MIKVAELEGSESMNTLNVYHRLLLGLKMLPLYANTPYEEFFGSIDILPVEQKEKFIREALLFVPLEREELEGCLSFCIDPNGVRYKAVNLKRMKPDEIFEMVVAVCLEIAKFKINFITPSEKKNLKISPLTSDAHS